MANPSEILKEEFRQKIGECLDMMETAPDFPCCLISLLLTRSMVNNLIRTTAEAIESAYPEMKSLMEDAKKMSRG